MSTERSVALITGGSRGIGEFIAIELARAGMDVVVAARTDQQHESKLEGDIESVAEQCRATGARALAQRLDLTDDASIDACLEAAIAEFGHIDFLVNNAGVLIPGSFHEVPIRRIDLAYRVNVRGPWVLSQALIPSMLERGGGVILNISSIAAEEDGLGRASYAVTKLADRKIAECIAAEYGSRGIRAYSLSPELLVSTPGTRLHGEVARTPPERIEPPEQMGLAALALFNDREGRYNGQHVFSGPLLREVVAAQQ